MMQLNLVVDIIEFLKEIPDIEFQYMGLAYKAVREWEGGFSMILGVQEGK